MKGRVENLKTPTTEEARERGRKGGQASGAARRAKKTMREWAEVFGSLPMDVPLPNGKVQKTDMAGAVVFSQFQSAIKKGNTKAAFFLANLRGELEEKVTVTSDQPLVIVRNPEEQKKIETIKDLDI